MKTNTYKLAIPAILLSFTCFSQSLEQKIYPTNPATTRSFGGDNLKFEENTLVVSDHRSYSAQGCEANHGSVVIYKKDIDTWTVSQTLSSSANDTVKFGYGVSFHHNWLAILSANEDSPLGYKTGVINVFRRADENSAFIPFTKIYGNAPFLNRPQNFNSIAINDNYLSATVANEVKVYAITQDTIIHHNTYFGNMYAPYKIKMTDNNLIVGIGDGISHYKIEEDTVKMLLTYRGGPYNELVDIEVDGQTIIHETHGGRSDNETSFSINTWNGNTLMPLDVFDVRLMRTSVSAIELKENEALILKVQNLNSTGGNEGSANIHIYKFSEGKYQPAGVIGMSTDATEAYGNQLAYSDELLAIGDVMDSTNTNFPTNACNGVAKGAISMVSLQNMDVITGMSESSQITTKSSISPNPLSGSTLSVNVPDANQIEVLSVSGFSLKTAPVVNNVCQLTGLPKGMYMIKISSPDKSKLERLVIE